MTPLHRRPPRPDSSPGLGVARHRDQERRPLGSQPRGSPAPGLMLPSPDGRAWLGDTAGARHPTRVPAGPRNAHRKPRRRPGSGSRSSDHWESQGVHTPPSRATVSIFSPEVKSIKNLAPTPQTPLPAAPAISPDASSAFLFMFLPRPHVGLPSPRHRSHVPQHRCLANLTTLRGSFVPPMKSFLSVLAGRGAAAPNSHRSRHLHPRAPGHECWLSSEPAVNTPHDPAEIWLFSEEAVLMLYPKTGRVRRRPETGFETSLTWALTGLRLCPQVSCKQTQNLAGLL